MSNRFDFDLLPGDAYPPGPDRYLTIILDEGAKDGGPYIELDLTGATIETKVSLHKKHLYDNTIATIVQPVTNILDQTLRPGAFTYRIDESVTGVLKPHRYSHRVTVIFPDTSRTTFLSGQIRVGSLGR